MMSPLQQKTRRVHIKDRRLLILEDPCSRLSTLGQSLPRLNVGPGETGLAVVGSVSRLAIQVVARTAQLHAHICHGACLVGANTESLQEWPLSIELQSY